MRVGYVSVSAADQNTARQDALMSDLNVEKIYMDKLSEKVLTSRSNRKMYEGYYKYTDWVHGVHEPILKERGKRDDID